MYRIMILDDEPIVREGLLTFPWNEIGCTVVVQAEDGVEGLEKLELFYPDIIITDIKMPAMNGIEFAQKVKEINSEIEVVILTGFADFDYAKEALKAGVSDYILKPFNFDDIKKAIIPCIFRIGEQEQKQEQVFALNKLLSTIQPLLKEQILQDLLDGKIKKDSEKVEVCDFAESKYIVFSMQSDFGNQDIQDLALYGILKKEISGMHECFYLARGTDIVSCVLFFKPDKSDGFCEQVAINFCNMVQKQIEEQYCFSISAGISRVSKDIYGLSNLRKQSIKALNQRYSMGNDLIMLYSDMERILNLEDMDLSSAECALHKYLIQNNTEMIEKQFRSIAQHVAGTTKEEEHVKVRLLEFLFHAIHFVNAAMPENHLPYDSIQYLLKCESLENFIQNCLRILLALPNGKHESAHQYITDKILSYIANNYDKDISLDTLSRQLNYSNTYLSRLIKRNCGKNFMELLLECRVKHAKELLEKSCYKVNQISGMVGYPDTSYFVQVFKKKMGITPSEYRSLFLIEKEI